MIYNAILIRLRFRSNEKQTCGRFLLFDLDGNLVYQAASLELPWLMNQVNISCIPEGHYVAEKVNSPKFGADTFSIKDVPYRDHILIHPGNFTRDIQGCILLGEKLAFIDNDDIADVANSKATINKLKKLADSFTLQIISI